MQKFLASPTPGLCPGCATHVSWVGVEILPGMGVDLKRMAQCRYREEHTAMKEALNDRNNPPEPDWTLAGI